METAAPQSGAGHRHQGSFSEPPSPLSPPLSPASAAAAALANARWTPTKEQIAVLEGLYRQGLRTPTTEQIQQITARLREHGHIEGKNVFYWFQNHKARQRQKQKQQSFDYFSKLFRRPPPLPVLHRPLARPFALAMPPPPAPATTTTCNTGGVMYRPPSFMPAAANAGNYPQQRTPVLYPPGMELMEVSPHDKVTVQPPTSSMYLTAPNSAHFAPAARRGGDRAAEGEGGGGGFTGRETLQLFPLQPTFVLPDNKPRRAGSACAAVSLTASALYSGESESSDSPNSEAPPFYDFFGVHSGGC
ncbi:hypothetical protein E2562_029350 [Oryza meyeriana var. granulata]|uniref:Homeobox domain-containing protein n=1 Tax=Oryza meyeriana var. granulata TaxID=110450 RepID=A0A6G1E4R0_9ORYZ|nr:hypothetical protein E2562_029350 [Oryza meyeriana var. granulata]